MRCLLPAVLLVVGCSSRPDSPRESADTGGGPVAVKAVKSAVPVGKIGELFSERGMIPISQTKEGFSEMQEAIRIGSKPLLQRLLAKGNVVVEDSGAGALVIKEEDGLLFIQVTLGKNPDLEGWTAGYLIRKYEPPELLSDGNRVRIASDSQSGQFPLCPDERVFAELYKAVMNEDADSARMIMGSDKVYHVANNTVATVIRSVPNGCFVRITDGYFDGREGWIPSRTVRPVVR